MPEAEARQGHAPSRRKVTWSTPLVVAVLVGVAWHYFATWALYRPPAGTGAWIVHLLFCASLALNAALLLRIFQRSRH